VVRQRITVDGRAEIYAPQDPLLGPYESADAEDKTMFLEGPVEINSDGPISVEVEMFDEDQDGGQA
jgi:hypothetical protein